MRFLLSAPSRWAGQLFDFPDLPAGVRFRQIRLTALRNDWRDKAPVVRPIEDFGYGVHDWPCATTGATSCRLAVRGNNPELGSRRPDAVSLQRYLDAQRGAMTARLQLQLAA